ncbi:MAG: right-handed parallel beta-helix repeat-containing protein, partial [Armatimonadota bacterium]
AADDAAESRLNVVDNNHIHDGGHVYPAGVGVWVAQSSRNSISHNEIQDFRYSGMSIGWNWNDAPNRCHHNVIEYNHVHHVMSGVLNDGGGIYTLGSSPGSVIRNNVFHDVWPYSAIGWGIYLDATTNGYLVENNVVYNTLSGGLMYHNGGHENVIRNNVFAFSAQQALWPYWAEKPNTFRNNIVYFTQGVLFIPFAERCLQQRLDAGESLGEWDYNVYYNPEDADFTFFRREFEEWRALGLDRHSVIADPEFADPEAYDFSLKPTSPALRLGFEPIDRSRVGLYGDPDWVNEPRRIEHPPTRLPPPPPPPKPTPVDDGFENTVVGARPEGAIVSGEEMGASIRVTDEEAANGRHSLKFTDVAGLEPAWQPHMFYQPHFVEGTVRQSFEVLLRPGALVFTEWRDAGPYPQNIGPSVTFDGSGQVRASGRPLAPVPVGEWVHVEIECGLGKEAPGTYRVTIKARGREEQRFDEIPFTGEDFRELHWLGFVSNSTADSVFYLDDVRLQPLRR